MRDGWIKLRRLFRSYAKDECLPGLISLANFKILKSHAVWKRVMRCPIDTSAIDPNAQIGFDIMRRDSPVLRDPGQRIVPKLFACIWRRRGRWLVGSAQGNR